jgi:putative endonuclease
MTILNPNTCHPPLYAGDPCRDIAEKTIGGHAGDMYFVYLMASQRNGTLYCGVTNNLLRRAYEHREGLVGGFTERHGVKRFVWFEPHDSIEHAIQREKRIKNYPRQWKVNLIEA